MGRRRAAQAAPVVAVTPPDPNEPMATTLARMDEKLNSIITKDADHEYRLRSVERTLWLGIGFAAAVGSAVGSAAPQLLR